MQLYSETSTKIFVINVLCMNRLVVSQIKRVTIKFFYDNYVVVKLNSLFFSLSYERDCEISFYFLCFPQSFIENSCSYCR